MPVQKSKAPPANILPKPSQQNKINVCKRLASLTSCFYKNKLSCASCSYNLPLEEIEGIVMCDEHAALLLYTLHLRAVAQDALERKRSA